MGYRISVDTGGTFTDIMVLDEAKGSLHIGKALTTPARIFEGMREAIGVVAEELKISTEVLLREAPILIYGTTRATNAVVTKPGESVAGQPELGRIRGGGGSRGIGTPDPAGNGRRDAGGRQNVDRFPR